MDRFFMNGGFQLNGQVEVSTSKNATLPILAACTLIEEEVTLKQIPHFSDIDIMLNILASLGAKINRQKNAVTLNTSFLTETTLPEDLTKQVRASIFLMGPILAKYKTLKIAYPGGCNIGARPIDLHLNGLRTLGAKIIEQHGFIYCDGTNMKANTLYLTFPSVGATENLMMASVFLKGESKITGAAREPEIVDLANFLNKAGANILGAGTDTIIIKGVKKLNTIVYKPIPDRIIAGTYLIAGAMTGGKIELKNVEKSHISSLIDKLKNSACNIECNFDRIKMSSKGMYRALGNIETQPYPGFPTDLQAPMMAMQTVADGVTVLSENVFESRFKQVPELMRMGANIIVKDNLAIITGEKTLYGATVEASDLRAGASLVLAGLIAKGYTTIENVHHIDRGYEQLELTLQSLGADIKRI